MIFGVIFIYIAINLYIYITKDSLSIYVVQAEALNDYSTKKALILREENMVYAKEAGYINYYLADASRVAKGSKLCSVAEETDIYSLFNDYHELNSLNKDNMVQVKNNIISFRNNFDTSDYSDVINVKDSLTGKVRELIDENLIAGLPELIKLTGTGIDFKTVYSDESGIVSFYSDEYTGYHLDNVNYDIFEKSDDYSNKSLRTKERIELGDAVCRLVTDENWQILFPITEDEYIELQDKKKLTVYLTKDKNSLTAPIEFINKSGRIYCLMSLNNYLLRYINERFLELEIRTDSEKGLSIPQSSIVEKDFYLIPINYIYKDINNRETIYKEVYDEKDGSVSVEQEPISYMYNDGTYIYVNTGSINQGTRLTDNNGGNQYIISTIGKLYGVYQVNKGYSIFTRIEKLYDNSEYCIVRRDTPQGLKLYDHILLEGNKAQESTLIY